LRVNEKDAEGDHAGLAKIAMKLLFGRGLAWEEYERKRQLKVKAAISDLRNEVSHIHFALEV
jgi:hypothetical protein